MWFEFRVVGVGGIMVVNFSFVLFLRFLFRDFVAFFYTDSGLYVVGFGRRDVSIRDFYEGLKCFKGLRLFFFVFIVIVRSIRIN